MKILTYSENGGAVLEVNQSEFRELNMLIKSVERKTLDETYDYSFNRDRIFFQEVNLSSIFGAIQAFYLQRFRVNDIKRGLDILNKALE